MGNAQFTRLKDWLDYRMLRGKYSFSKKDILDLSLPVSGQSIENSLTRLSGKGNIMSPWRNFYVIVPVEYRLNGVVPPSFYVDALMSHLGRRYYVALLSAAALNGASHQKPMVYQIMVSGGQLRSGVKNGTRLEFFLRNDLPEEYTVKMKTQSGYINVSGPELTGLDLVAREENVGGLGRVAEILTELAETMRWDESRAGLLDCFNIPDIQRLGFLLEKIGEGSLADDLYGLMEQSGKAMRKVGLKRTLGTDDDMPVNRRWKIIENYEIDFDEI